MKIQVDRIPSDGIRFNLEDPIEAYDMAYLDFVFKDPISISVGAQVVSGNLVVSGKLSTKIQMTCSRCLKVFSRDWEDASYHFDCQVTGPNEIIDLTDHIREDIIVGLPLKPLCKQECRGLCTKCGIDLNLAGCGCAKKSGDPRWADLNKLKLE